MVLLHPAEASVNQVDQVTSGLIQPEMAAQYTSKLLGSLRGYPQKNPQLGLWEELHRVDTRTLGAVQIIIGLIHIGFGSVSTVFLEAYTEYTLLAIYGGYPFWAAIFFIASGSLSVSAVKLRNTCLVQCSVGMNITSAVMALIGVILYTAELIINLYDLDYNLTESIGFGLGLLLLIFSLLEFCITVSSAHFGCQAACCKNDMTVVVVPYSLIGSGAVSAEDNPADAGPPPKAHAEDIPVEATVSSSAHDNVAFCP